ncbi:extracellular calcium-sensing receptor-like [Lissotriton helveticus]
MALISLVLLLHWWTDKSSAIDTLVPRCALPSLNMEAYSMDGDVIFGGIAPFHVESFFPASNLRFQDIPAPRFCQSPSIDSYLAILAMVFATNEINRNAELLPKTNLGFKIFNSCGSDAVPIAMTLQMLSGRNKTTPNFICCSTPKMIGFIGDSRSSSAVAMARVLGVNRVPQISHGAALPALSDKTQFPSFLRTVTSVDIQPLALVQLLLIFKWTWIGILISNNDVCLQGSQMLKEEAEKRRICIEFFETLPTVPSRGSLDHFLRILLQSTATVIVCYAYDVHILPILKEMSVLGFSGKVWIGITSLMPSPLFSPRELWKMLNGTLGMAVPNSDIPGFKEFIYGIIPSKNPGDIFLTKIWEQIFSCIWMGELKKTGPGNTLNWTRHCSGTESLQGLDSSVLAAKFTFAAYNAIYALAQALHDLISCKPQEGPFANNSCADPQNFQPWQILHYAKNAHTRSSAGIVALFDANGDSPPFLDLLYWHMTSSNTSSFEKVGTYDGRAPAGNQLTVNISAIHWGGKYTEVPKSVCSESCPPGERISAIAGRPTCCFQCLPCAEGTISNHSDSLDCMKCPDDQWSNRRRDACIPRTIEFLSFEEPLGFILVLISVLFFLNTTWVFWVFRWYHQTAVVRANNLQLSYILLVGLMLCFLCSLFFIGQPRRVTCMLRQVIFGISFSLCVSCLLAKTSIVVIAFRATKPNSTLKKWIGPKTSYSIVLVSSLTQSTIGAIWLWTSPSFPELNTNDLYGKIIAECNEGSIVLFYCMLTFMGILACICFVVAFLARNLPDTFNEAKFITFSMLVFVSVWLSFIPAYISTKGKYLVAVEIFAILSSGAGLLYGIFAPKIYIIFLRPEMNTREYLMSKSKSDKNK